jgi:3-oxoacyl-[acyl-carrier-protein] synthase II
VALYIKGMGAISPQKTWEDENLLSQVFDQTGDRLTCVEPDYAQWLDARQLRRMSRVLKMGATSAFMALKEAGVSKPDAIITGTGYGCLDDTGIFLSKLIENNEQALNPTPFIQSTHNTIGSQIALLQQCQGYNNTFVQGAFSFENAVLDAMLLLAESPGQNVLIGGVDETTDISHTLLKRFRVFRKGVRSTLNLFKTNGQGTINGEGATYLLAGNEPGAHDIACLEGISMFYKAGAPTLKLGLERFLAGHQLKASDIDFVLLGRSGDTTADADLNRVQAEMFPASSIGLFKHLCGEYPVASAFAVFLAARILQDRHVPDAVIYKDSSKPLRNILVFNQYFGTHYSAMLLRSCRGTL